MRLNPRLNLPYVRLPIHLRNAKPLLVSHDADPGDGSTTFAVAGYDFEVGAAVRIDGKAATVDFVGENFLRATAPMGTVSTARVDVEVQNPIGGVGLLDDGFLYTGVDAIRSARRVLPPRRDRLRRLPRSIAGRRGGSPRGGWPRSPGGRGKVGRGRSPRHT